MSVEEDVDRLAKQLADVKLDEQSDQYDSLIRTLLVVDDDDLAQYYALKKIAQNVRSRTYKNIIVMTGAGISVAAGIPDFRSPGTGLYDNLEKYNLPYPEAIFELNFFYQNPEPFFELAKELYPGLYDPTLSHFFIKSLEDAELMVRNFTQNIDGLERLAGIDPKSLVEAHGTFATASCSLCGEPSSSEEVKSSIDEDILPYCNDTDCSGVVKPNIVFFGESLPERFVDCANSDFFLCDLLIVMGTSLNVAPFCNLVGYVRDDVPRILINRDCVGPWSNKNPSHSDVFLQGNCDDVVVVLNELFGLESPVAMNERYKQRQGE